MYCYEVLTIDQSHRCGHRQAACREPAGSYDKTTRTPICFEHKTQYLLIRAPYTRIVVFWHISKIPPWLGRVKLVVIPPHVLYSNYICEILLYNWQLVVITHELIYGVRVLSARGKIIVKQVYWASNSKSTALALPDFLLDTAHNVSKFFRNITISGQL